MLFLFLSDFQNIGDKNIKMKELSVNHLLCIKYINKSDIDLIFETADHFKEIVLDAQKRDRRFGGL